MKTEVHKVTLLIVDHDHLGADEIRLVLENQRYPNDCIYPTAKQIETVSIEWDDDHPLNRRATAQAEYERLFPPPRDTRS